MINKVILVGRLTKDIEVRKTPNGISTTSFSIACNKKINGEQRADFVPCVAWQQSADYLGQYSHKGDIIEVEGHISTRNYESNGRKVYVVEVVCERVGIISQQKKEQQNYTQQSVNGNYDALGYNNSVDPLSINADELPFY